MKHMSIARLILCLCVTTTTVAQTSSQNEDDGIGGAGTPNFIAKFSGKHTIANSNIFQSPTTGNLGIGTTTPDSTLTIWNFTDSLTDGLEPYAIYGALFNSTINFSAAIRGDSLATNGGGNGVIGLTSSAGGAGVRGVSVASEWSTG